MMPDLVTKKKLHILNSINLIEYNKNVVGFNLHILIDLIKLNTIMSSKVMANI